MKKDLRDLEPDSSTPSTHGLRTHLDLVEDWCSRFVVYKAGFWAPDLMAAYVYAAPSRVSQSRSGFSVFKV